MCDKSDRSMLMKNDSERSSVENCINLLIQLFSSQICEHFCWAKENCIYIKPNKN